MRSPYRDVLAGRRIAVIGAGPIGLEAALYASVLGATVRVYEGSEVAKHVRDWGHIVLFTPFGMNHTPLGRRTLEAAGCALPSNDAVQSGAEWRESYLLPLAERTGLADAVVQGARVITLGRGSLLKGDHIGNGQRAESPFRLLIQTNERERYEEADVLLDCSGSWGNPNWLGRGGVPALGEREARQHIDYHPIDVAGAQRTRFAGRRTLLVGDGLSAATTAVALAGLARDVSETEAVWATRGSGRLPITAIADDALPRRAELTATANKIAGERTAALEWLDGAEVTAVRWRPGPQDFDVELATPAGGRRERFDRVIANVGYAPDDSLYRELQVHECYASGAPMKLAAALLAASGAAGGDCLKLGGLGPDVLVSPEPNFFILGMKSYGRNSAFLLQTGHEQVRDVYRLLTRRSDLDLYALPDALAEV